MVLFNFFELRESKIERQLYVWFVVQTKTKCKKERTMLSEQQAVSNEERPKKAQCSQKKNVRGTC